jgi:hypothetical protein
MASYYLGKCRECMAEIGPHDTLAENELAVLRHYYWTHPEQFDVAARAIARGVAHVSPRDGL